MKKALPLLIIATALLISACSPTRALKDNQYMLLRNNVDVKGAPGTDFDDLKSYCRPIPNNRFLTIFLVKPRLYAMGLPTVDKNGQIKDSKTKKWLREKVGEPPVLLDSSEIDNSINQLQIVMKQSGYFDADISYHVRHNKHNPKKVKVNYSIQANEPYRISSITYNIDIPEYKKIIILNKDETLLSPGMLYNETVISNELTRIINLIRDEGYYYVEKSIISCEVSYDPPQDSLNTNPHTVSLEIIMKIPSSDNASRYLYKYTYHNVYIFPNHSSINNFVQQYDTVSFHSRNKSDHTRYLFITPHYNWLEKPLKDFHYGTLADAIYSKRGIPYSQIVRRRSSQAIGQLDNFSYYSIEYKENEKLLDTVNRTGALDSYFYLTPMKIHSIGGQLDLRNDKSAISFTYTNRNIFKGAEHLTINVSGGYFYYSLSNLFRHNTTYAYPEFGLGATLTFPKLFLFKRTQKVTGIRYSTSVNASVNYNGLYRRLMYNIGMTYNWSPTYYLNHSVTPIDISTINNSDRRAARLLNYDNYPDSYQNKFGKYFLLSFKYSMNYLVPFDITRNRHNMRISINFESSGLLLKGLNALITPDHRWTLGRNRLDSIGYAYSTFEKLEATWHYTYKINTNNAIATRFSAGGIIPIDKDSYIPYERGFYLGTSNSMRGWGYRGLGPGAYEHGKDSLYTGDIKIELNLEYRGTLYKSFKYGLFSDIGNIWLSRKNDDMPMAEFDFKRFYKELAIDVGVGLRLDFNFLVFRLDYALPIYDPTRSSHGAWINKQWFNHPTRPFRWANGIKLAIGYAF